MDCWNSCFKPGDRVIVEHKRFYAVGVVIGAPDNPKKPYPEPRVKVHVFRNDLDVPIEHTRLAPMTTTPVDPMREAVAGMPREMLETGYLEAHAQLARRLLEIEGLNEVVVAQCEALGEATAVSASSPPSKVVRRAVLSGLTAEGEDGGEWFERLVDLLETYLVRTLGERHPLRIDDSDLRALVAHILD